jgi:hypothetical protein
VRACAQCRFPGCGLPFGQGHHIHHWAEGGPTTLSNLTLLCRRHHRAVHEEGYQVERLPDGELQFRRPNGWLLPQVPSPPEVPDDVVDVLRARHDADGLVLDAHTATPGWFGETLDVGWAIDVMHPLATMNDMSPIAQLAQFGGDGERGFEDLNDLRGAAEAW